MIGWRAAATLLLLGCSPVPGPQEQRAQLEQRLRAVNARAAAADAAVAQGKPAAEPIARWILPPRFKEISGLALTVDGRLLAHGDETSEIWEIDYRRGVIMKTFMLGEEALTADFEAIAVVGAQVYLLDSKGRIYEGSEGGAGKAVPYNEYDTKLRKACEFEGMVFDPATHAMLLACKHVYAGAPQDALVIYRWGLPGSPPPSPTPLVIPIEQLRAAGGHWKRFEASEITRDQRTGHFLVMSSLQSGLVELSPEGALLRVGNIPGSHRQPEGAAITPDGRLIVADEAGGDRPLITVYSRPFP